MSKPRMAVCAMGLCAVALCGGCAYVWNAADNAWRDNVGAASWAYGADLGGGKIVSVEERTHRTGMLLAKFRASVECWTASFDEPLADGGTVRCQIILPNTWNGTLWLVANNCPDGELPSQAVSFAQDGSAVVFCDGGMGQVRLGNGRINPFAAGARSPSLRKAFYHEVLSLALEDGKILAERKYGRPVEKVNCFGREVGGAQALFLLLQDPSAVSELYLVNPELDFAACAAYDLNIARHVDTGTGYGRFVRPSQFAAIQRAAKDLKLKTFDSSMTNELWLAAGKYDDSYSYNPNAVARICQAWTMLLSEGILKSDGKTIIVPPVRFDMDFESRMSERSWRLAWLFGEHAMVEEISNDDYLRRLPEMSAYTPSVDLSPFLQAGGTLHLALESANARVPAQLAEKLAVKEAKVKRTEMLKDDAEWAHARL